MKTSMSRAKRRLIAAKIDLLDVSSGAEIISDIIDLSYSGCRLNRTTLRPGSKVRVCIIYRGTVFMAFARIVRVATTGETAITFTKIEPKDRATLDNWLAQAHDVRGAKTAHIHAPQMQ